MLCGHDFRVSKCFVTDDGGKRHVCQSRSKLAGDAYRALVTETPLNDLTEGDGALHRVRVLGEVAGEPLFAEGFPAADDAGGVVHFELVVVVFEEVGEALADDVFGDGEDEDFVVSEEL